jgi:hypothetical protein
MQPATSVVFHDDKVSAGTWGPIFFEIWQGQGSPVHFRTLREAALRFARTQGSGKILQFTTVRVFSVPSMDAEMRNEVQLRRQALIPYTFDALTVIESKGFVASIVRSIAAGVLSAIKPSYTSRIFGTVEEACPWAAERLASKGLAATVADIRAAHDEIARGGPGLAR